MGGGASASQPGTSAATTTTTPGGVTGAVEPEAAVPPAVFEVQGAVLHARVRAGACWCVWVEEGLLTPKRAGHMGCSILYR